MKYKMAKYLLHVFVTMYLNQFLYGIFTQKEKWVLRLGFSDLSVFENINKYYYNNVSEVFFPDDNWEIRKALISDVEYVDDISSHIAYHDPLDTGARIPYSINIGLIKEKIWEYEKETRVRVYIDVNKKSSSIESYKPLKYRNLNKKNIFCKIGNFELKNMTITFSPFMSESQKNIVKETVMGFLPDYPENNFSNSILDGKIRI